MLDWDSWVEAYQLKMVQRTKKDTRIFRLWKKSPYIEVRIAAIYKLENQELLAQIAQNEPVDELRFEAVRKLIDKTLLARIAIKDKRDYIRFAAQQKHAYTGNKTWDASEIDEEAVKVIVTFFEHNARLHFLATGQRADEEWW